MLKYITIFLLLTSTVTAEEWIPGAIVKNKIEFLIYESKGRSEVVQLKDDVFIRAYMTPSDYRRIIKKDAQICIRGVKSTSKWLEIHGTLTKSNTEVSFHIFAGCRYNKREDTFEEISARKPSQEDINLVFTLIQQGKIQELD